MIIKLPKNIETRTRKFPQFLVLLFTFFMSGAFAFLAAKNPNDTTAANAADFRAGNIISDYVMSDSGTMSEGDIQAFLKSKNHCNDRDWNKYQSYSSQGYHYHWEDGHFVCMADENFNGESAAHIIWQAAQDYHINPQVLIVLLQKEQSLVTDTWPTMRQLDFAVGYGCPDDSEGCRAERAGFRKQIRWAAELFREVLDGGWTNYPVGWNLIKYHPEDWRCGSSYVYVENLATSALYRYTPYQPNQAALDAGYGEGYCGSYGNRNFFLYFTDWFGSTQNAAPSNDYLANGTYLLKSVLSSDRFLTSNNGTMENASFNFGSQQWKIVAGDTYYSLMDTTTNKYLTNNNGALALEDSNPTCNQRWIFHKNSDGSFTLYSRCSYQVLDVYGGFKDDHTKIQTFTSNGTIAQKWQLVNADLLSNLNSANITNGIYVIHSKVNPEMSIDVGNATSGDGANIQLWGNNYTIAQKFRFTRNTDDNTYTIQNITVDGALDLANAGTVGGTNVQQYTSNGTCAQRWYAISVGSEYRFLSKCNPTMAIEIGGGKVDYGANVQIWENNGTPAQLWSLESTNSINGQANDNTLINGTYAITSAADKTKAVDVNNTGVVNGTNIHLYMQWGGKTNRAQQWTITRLVNGNYTVVNPNSNKALDVAGGITTDRTNVWLYEQNGTCAQQWKITKQLNGAYQFASACNDKEVLDLSNAETINGTNVQIYQAWGNDNKAQQWFLDKQ